MMPRRKKPAIAIVDPNKKYLSISDLSKEFDVTPRTIRHYEDEGLIEPARRGQTRLFTEDDRRRLEIALVGARLGIHLSKLRELFDFYDNARGDEKRTRQLLVFLGQQRQALARQQADIENMSEELARMEKECREIVEPTAEVKRDRAQQDLFG
jgi:DNA-binding transcriptional MerR regulator